MYLFFKPLNNQNMRKKLVFASVLIIAGVLIFYSCTKNAKQTVAIDSEELLYQKPASEPKSGVSTNSAGNIVIGWNTTKITKINYEHSALLSLRNSDEWKKVLNSYNLNTADIKRSSFYNSSVELINIPIIQSSRDQYYLNIYIKGGNFIITKMTISVLANGNQKFAVESLDGQPYYQVEINPENKIGNWKFGGTIPFKEILNKNQPPATIKMNTVDEGGGDDLNQDCTKLSWNDCMHCILVSYCSNDWTCLVACGLFIPSCVGGAALLCAL